MMVMHHGDMPGSHQSANVVAGELTDGSEWAAWLWMHLLMAQLNDLQGHYRRQVRPGTTLYLLYFNLTSLQ